VKKTKSSKRCANCNTERYGIYRSGHCERCYRLITEKGRVERWNVKDPSSWKGFPRSFLSFSQRYLEDEFPKIKAKRLKEFEVRLRLLKTKEAQRTGEVSGLDIERALGRLAKWSGGKEDVMHGIASIVTYHFGPEPRRVLLGWLFDIEESMRWDPRRYWHLLNPEEVKRMAAQRRAESRLQTEPAKKRNRKQEWNL
jgi:hypothetical protein